MGSTITLGELLSCASWLSLMVVIEAVGFLTWIFIATWWEQRRWEDVD